MRKAFIIVSPPPSTIANRELTEFHAQLVNGYTDLWEMNYCTELDTRVFIGIGVPTISKHGTGDVVPYNNQNWVVTKITALVSKTSKISVEYEIENINNQNKITVPESVL